MLKSKKVSKDKMVLILIVNKNKKQFLDKLNIGGYICCILPIPYCNSKSDVNIQKSEEKYCFLCCISASYIN